MCDFDEFMCKVNARNKLRKDISTKKQMYAKMLQYPECLAETLVLKSEIDSLELELEGLR